MWLDSSPVMVLVLPSQPILPATVMGEAWALPESYSSYAEDI